MDFCIAIWWRKNVKSFGFPNDHEFFFKLYKDWSKNILVNSNVVQCRYLPKKFTKSFCLWNNIHINFSSKFQYGPYFFLHTYMKTFSTSFSTLLVHRSKATKNISFSWNGRNIVTEAKTKNHKNVVLLVYVIMLSARLLNIVFLMYNGIITRQNNQ